MNIQLKEVLNYFPITLKNDIQNSIKNYQNLQEIRLRINKPICIMADSKNIVLNNTLVTKKDINSVFINICENSVYTYQSEINQGFVTLKNGCRVGICGTAVEENDKIISIKNITSLNFRIACDYIGCAKEILDKCNGSYIIAGPPSSGKTTLLRDITRSISLKNIKVCVVDERFELTGTHEMFDLGYMTDSLRGYKKAYGVLLAIRTLSPQVVIFDEIGTLSECESVYECLNSGVKIITSVHCNSKYEFLKRPICKKLIESKCFDYIVFLGEKAGKIKEIINTEDLIV